MKRILILSVLVGLAVIAFLSGAVVYQVNKLKKQTQTTLNQSFKNYSLTLEKRNIGFYFSPFECEGLLHIQCKSPKAIFLSENALLFSLSSLSFSLKDFDAKSLRADFGFEVDEVQKSQDLEDYFEVLMPERVKGSIELSLQSKTDILAQTSVNFIAKNLDYNIQFDSKLTSEKFKDKGLLKNPFENLSDEPIRFIKMDLQLLAKDLSPALFEVIKKQYGGNLAFQDYQGLLAFLIALGKDQFSSSLTMQQMIQGVGELALGDKQQLHISLIAQEEICLNCQPFTLDRLQSVIEQSHIKVLIQ